MRIPFGTYKTLDVKAEDGVEASHTFMENAKKILESQPGHLSSKSYQPALDDQ